MVKTTAGIATRIQEEITAQNTSILRLSETSGVSRSTLNRRMADEDGFTMKELVKISVALGLPPHELAAHYFAEQGIAA